MVVHPGHAEQQAALRLHHTVHNAHLGQLGLLIVHGLEGFHNLAYSLEELGLMGVLLADAFVHVLEVRIGDRKCHNAKPLCLAALGGPTEI